MRAADSSAVLIAYNPTTISQQVNVSGIANTTLFTATANVAKNNWQNDFAYLEVRFKNSGGTTLATKRSPASGWTTLTSATPINLVVSLASGDPAWDAAIAKVEVVVGGDDGEFWAGNYGTAIDYVLLEQTDTSGTTQLLANPEFAGGSASWYSSAGWQTCSGGAGGAACVTTGYSPPTTTTTTTTTTSTTSTTTTSTTTTTVAPATSTTVPAASTTSSPVAPSTTATSDPGTTTSTLPTAGSGGSGGSADAPVAPGSAPPGTTSGSADADTVTRSATTLPAKSSAANSPPPRVTTSTSTTTTTAPPILRAAVDAPVDPDIVDALDDAESLGLVDGQPTDTDRRVGDGTVVVTVGPTSFQVAAADGSPTPLRVDAEGRVFLEGSMGFKVIVLGLAPDENFGIWLYSTPIEVLSARATSMGSYTGTARVPAGAPRGWHNLVLAGTRPDGKSVAASVPVNLPQQTNVIVKFARSAWVWVLIALAVAAAIALPGGGRRQRGPIIGR